MKLKVLIDNNTYIDEYVLGEPALAFYLEHENKKILLDTGYSHALIHNAKTYGIDLGDLDYIVLSHAHNDHTRGLNYLLAEYDLSNTNLIVNPRIYHDRQDDDGLDIGMVSTRGELEGKMKTIYAEDSFEIMDGLWFITNIRHHNDFENQRPVGRTNIDGGWCGDDMAEEGALVYVKDQTLNIMTGCSHRGICNLAEETKKITQIEKISSIIGGFHLFEVDEILEKTAAYFEENKVQHLYPCHCVSFKAKAFLNRYFDIKEIGVGFTLDYENMA